MAFATSELQCGSQGNRRYVAGKWTGTAGDAAGSLVIGSADIIGYDFDPNLTTGTQEKPFVTKSTSGGQTTLSIHYKQTVTNGKFKVEY